ncbi:MAG TPA: fused MFS/spermidine synthase [Coriobacteriia bacterium]
MDDGARPTLTDTSASGSFRGARRSGQGRLAAKGRWLLAAYAVSGLAALIYEVAWMRELGQTLGSTAYASGTMLAAFMTGLGIGSLLGGRLATRTPHPLRTAARAELAVGVTSIAALLALRFGPGVFFDLLGSARVSAATFLALQFAAAFAVMLLPTVAMGATYPLIMEAVGKRSRFGLWSGLLYTANTAGAIAGSLLAGFVLIPLLGVNGALLVAGATSFAVAALLSALAVEAEGARSFWRSPEPIVAIAALLAVAVVPAAPSIPLGVTMLDRLASSSEHSRLTSSVQVLYDDDGVYSHVSVLQYPTGLRVLRNGALIEGANSAMDRRTTALLAALPAASAAATSSSMVVGLGTGYTSAAMLHLGGERVETVEINPAVRDAAALFAGVQLASDPRWSLVIDDARARLLTSPDRFDVITSEPSWPLSAGVAPLFTREFMVAARSRLTEGGVFCQWLPNYLLRPDDVRMMYKTMRSVFPRVDAWAIIGPDGSERELALIGFDRAGTASQESLFERADAVTGSIGLPPDAYEIYSGAAGLETAVSDAAVPLNTDDHSLLEYRVLWNLLEARPASATAEVSAP